MRPSSILVIDDEPSAFETVEALLMREGYQLAWAPEANAALAHLETQMPDVILCDVMMPGMSGIDLCQKIKADPRWHHIPIITITALDSKEDLAKCIAAGADDFLTKPVNGIELRARIRSMLRIKQQYDALQTALTLREDMANMLVHDIRSPLTTILISAEFLDQSVLPDAEKSFVKEISNAANRLNAMANDLLTMAKMESGKWLKEVADTNLSDLVIRAVNELKAAAATKKIVLEGSVPSLPVRLKVNANLIFRVLDNLISNALKYTVRGSTVSVRLEPTSSGGAVLRIADQGGGIPEDVRDRIFNKYEVGTLKKSVSQVGLGLAFCKMVVDSHGGKIFVESNQPRGSVFVVELN
jgi:signal transduction histidine kinase